MTCPSSALHKQSNNSQNSHKMFRQTLSWSVSCQLSKSRLYNAGVKWGFGLPRKKQTAEFILNKNHCSYCMNTFNCIMKKDCFTNIQNLFVFVSNSQDLNVSVLPPRPWLLVCTSVFLHFSFSSTCHQVSHLWLCKIMFTVQSGQSVKKYLYFFPFLSQHFKEDKS